MTVPDCNSDRNGETRFPGVAICPGVAVGQVCLFNERRHVNLPAHKVLDQDRPHEIRRLEEAIAAVSMQLGAVAQDVAGRVGPTEAEIFKVQRMLLQDARMQKQMVEAIEIGSVNAETAASRVLDSYETRIGQVDSQYIKERATDLGEIRRRLLGALGTLHASFECAGEEHCQRGRNRIIVAEELTPRLTVELEAHHTLGFVTEHGGPTSHAAILARALGIPAVSGIGGIYGRISCGTEVLIDGVAGVLIVWPTRSTLVSYGVSKRRARRFLEAVEPVPGLEVMANIRLASEVSEAVAMQAEGIGLYRTEFEFLTAGRELSEQEQFERYAAVIEAMKGRPVTFRLLDFGGDKAASFLNLPQEANPYLGLRGSRLLLARPELLRPQARALARAAALAPVRVLYPMIVESEQFLAVKEMFLASVSGLCVENLAHGVLFEVPAACLDARRILEVADFGSIGTNDLVQYLFAIDRNSELVAGAYEPQNSVLWSLVGHLCRAAGETGRSLSVCGEAGGDPKLLAAFMDAGIRSVSVSPQRIPALRRAARSRSVPGAQS